LKQLINTEVVVVPLVGALQLLLDLPVQLGFAQAAIEEVQHDALVVLVDLLLFPQLQQLAFLVDASRIPPPSPRTIPSFLFIIHQILLPMPVTPPSQSEIIFTQ
jgi:hypothetical protein